MTRINDGPRVDKAQDFAHMQQTQGQSRTISDAPRPPHSEDSMSRIQSDLEPRNGFSFIDILDWIVDKLPL